MSGILCKQGRVDISLNLFSGSFAKHAFSPFNIYVTILTILPFKKYPLN